MAELCPGCTAAVSDCVARGITAGCSTCATDAGDFSVILSMPARNNQQGLIMRYFIAAKLFDLQGEFFSEQLK